MNNIRDRLVGVPAALLLQLLFIAILIHALRPLMPSKRFIHELTLTLPRAQPTPKPLMRSRQPSARHTRQRPSLAAPPLVLPDRTVPPSENVQRLGESLFDCAPENFANLPVEEQARCPKPGGDLTARDAPDLMGSPSHIQDEAHWTAELARKQAPLWLPCTTQIATPRGGLALGFDYLCIASKIADGTLTDPHTWPLYKRELYT